MADEQEIPAYFANLSLNHYKRFIKDGSLDRQRLIDEMNFNEGQVNELSGILTDLGWLGVVEDQPVEPAEAEQPKRSRKRIEEETAEEPPAE